MTVYCSTFEDKTSTCFYTGVYTCRLYCENVNRTSGVSQLLLADVLANLTSWLLTLWGAATFGSRKNGYSHALLYFNCQCAMPAPASDGSGRSVSHIQTHLPDLFISDFHNVQQENVRKEEGAVSQPLTVHQAWWAAHTFGDRVRHRHKFRVLSGWLQGDLHWPQSPFREVPEEKHGGERPPEVWAICGGIGGGHGVSRGRVGRRCCLHPGALLCQQHTANSAWGVPHTETSKSSTDSWKRPEKKNVIPTNLQM